MKKYIQPTIEVTEIEAEALMAANPDVVDFADLTGCSLKVDESREELLREG